MVKGKYVAKVEIDFGFDETAQGYPPFEEIKKNLDYSTDKGLQEIVQEDIAGVGTVRVERELFDLYQVGE